MTSTDTYHFGFAKLGDDNYGTWKVQMRGLLATKGCETALTTENDPHSSKAKGLMIMCVEQQHLQTIEDAANARDAWNALAALYQQTSTANLMQLKKQLAGLEKRPTETISQYLARARAIASQIQAATGTAVDATDMALAVLSGLPSEYNVIKTIIENTTPLPSLAEIQAKLLLVEKQQETTEGDTAAYYTKVIQQAQRRRPSFAPWNADKECWLCHKKGHIQRECPERGKHEHDEEHNEATYLAVPGFIGI
jgi:molybdopterin-biosynthesis enzyme MoeA-like protein